jgi:hypothetical protein
MPGPDPAAVVHFQVPTDPWYIFNCPQLVHFACPPRIDAWVANGMKNRTMGYASIERYKERQISGLGTCLISGSYDDAAQMFKQLHDAGLNGMAVGLIDYLNDATAFRDEVMPRLEHLGLRSDKAFIASQLHTGRSNLRPSHSD